MKLSRKIFAFLFGFLSVLSHGGPAAALELVMFEREGCSWCERWNAEIGGIYPRTDEGRAAPLRRVDILAPVPDDLAWMTVERFTPSFALVHDGVEYGRIRGYPGEDFFWGLLGEMLENARTQVPDTTKAPATPAG